MHMLHINRAVSEDPEVADSYQLLLTDGRKFDIVDLLARMSDEEIQCVVEAIDKVMLERQ